jgi:hypothetical protein
MKRKVPFYTALLNTAISRNYNPNVKRGLSASQTLAMYFLSNNFQKNILQVQFQKYTVILSTLTPLWVKIPR